MLVMPRHLACGATLIAALILTIGDANARRFQAANIQKDLEDLVHLVSAKKVNQAKVNAQVAAMQKNHSLVDIKAMVYKPTKLEGIGYDPAKKGPGDGIEKRLIDLGTKKELTKAELLAQKALILRAAYYNLAIYEVTKAFPPAKNTKNWHRHNIEMRAGTENVILAVKANDPKALKKAMSRVNAGCNECHTEFR